MEKEISVLDYINYLVEEEGYSEEEAELCANIIFSDDFSVDD